VFAFALSGKTKTSDMYVEMNKNYNKFKIFRVACPLTASQLHCLNVAEQRVYQITFKNIDKFKN